jgi:EmrB/QacA subfamily drug resistance transporter
MARSPAYSSITTPLNFRQKLLSMLGLCFVLVMVALDQTVIGTALPTVVAELNGFDLYAWVGTAYLLTSIITIPIFGKLGDEHGRKPFVVGAIVLFTTASMLCGLAQSMQQLVLARALQGIGGGMLVATSFASVPDMFPEAYERLRWQILFSSSFGLANAIGPSLGGFLTEYLGWRWVFFVNLPVGIMGLWFVWRYLPRIRHSDNPPSPLDWLGALLVALTLGSLQLLVEWLPQHKPAVVLITLISVGVVSGIALIWWERRSSNPIVPLSMFTHHSLKPIFAMSLIMGFCMFAVTYYAPLLFQGGFGLSPKDAGMLLTPLAVFITVGSIVNGRIVTRLPSPKIMLYAGLGSFCAAALTLTQTTIATPHTLLGVSMVLAGLGLGILLPNLTLLAQAIAPRVQLGVATAILQSTRMIGGMLGIALIGTLVSNRYARYVDVMLQTSNGNQWASWLNNPQILVDHTLATRFSTAVQLSGSDASTLLEGARTGLVNAIHDSQWLVAIIVVLAIWVARKVPAISLHRSIVQQEASHE